MKPYQFFAFLPSILCLIFITLKLTKHITWSWLWVISPVWIQTGTVILLLLLIRWINYLLRPRTPEERLAASCRAMAKAIRNNRH